jgi:acyl carrier protein
MGRELWGKLAPVPRRRIMRDDILSTVVAHLEEVLDEELSAGGEPVSSLELRSDLGVTSLESVNLVMALEESFDIEIADEEIPTLQRVEDVVELVERKLFDRRSGASG